MRNGVQEERAFSMDHVERLGWCIVLGRLEGNAWDWDEMAWRRRDER
jgi:hypothetical protein